MQVDGVMLPMELDTGAAVSIVSHAKWQRCSDKPLDKSNLLLTTYSNEKINVIGQTMVQVKYDGEEETLPLIVVAGNGPHELARENPNRPEKLENTASSQRQANSGEPDQEYEKLFQPGVGTLKEYKAKLSFKQGSVPKFFKPRSVPHAINENSYRKELDRLETERVLERISWSEYASPIVAVPKSDGSVKICRDYKVSIKS